MDKVYKKLVRDKIPEIIKNSGGEADIEVIGDDQGYLQALLAKLGEEVEEVRRAEADHLLEELGDVETVVEAILKVKGWKAEDLRTQKDRKDEERGKFEKRIFLIKASTSSANN
jgi:predicted house-cleaning noncanonical NTP pyrophosphatase (MazG superfamily)